MQTVKSVIGQVTQLVIVDNASHDDSISLLLKHYGDEDKIKLITNDENVGFAAACNIGAQYAEGGYLLFLNPDCIADPCAADALLQTLLGNEKFKAAGALLLDENRVEQAGSRRLMPTPWRSLVQVLGLHRLQDRYPRLFVDFNLYQQSVPENPIEVEAFSGACILLKNSVFTELGGWDDGYFMHCEDLDLSMRIRRSGGKIAFVPNAHVIHYQGSCSKSRPIFVEWHKHKGMMRFYKKFFRHQYPGVLMWLVAIAVWIRFGFIAAIKGLRNLFSLRDALIENSWSFRRK